jgi:hypothetical protein
MKTILWAAGAVAVAFTAGQALAARTPKMPKQPIPYAELNAYLKASPKQQASKDWSAGDVASASAATGASANASANAPAASPSLPADTTGSSNSANPPSTGGESKGSSPSATPATPVNPSPSPSAAAPGSPDTAKTPPK